MEAKIETEYTLGLPFKLGKINIKIDCILLPDSWEIPTGDICATPKKRNPEKVS